VRVDERTRARGSAGTANAVDATGDAEPRWWVLDRAIAAGARPVADGTAE
jgi:hypothetical protein